MDAEAGIVYVVHNEWIRNPDSNGNVPYKIGITKNSVSDRYYGLGLKMPGKFVCDFAYEFSTGYEEVETILHQMLDKSRLNGEWFAIGSTELDAIKKSCERFGGTLVTESVENGITKEISGTIKEKMFVYDGKKYIARQYRPEKDPNAIYGGIFCGNSKCDNMKNIVRGYLKNKGHDIPIDANTHSAVKILIDLLESEPDKN